MSSKKTKGETRIPVEYAEVNAYGVDLKRFRESPLGIGQALDGIFMFVTLVIFVIESQYIQFIDVWMFAIIYAAVGFSVKLVVLILWIMYLKGNRAPVQKGDATVNYMGFAHTKALTIGVFASWLTFGFICWQMFDWITRFNKTSSNSDPDPTKNPEYTVYYGMIQVGYFMSSIAVVFISLAIAAHMKPLKNITTIIQNIVVPQKNV